MKSPDAHFDLLFGINVKEVVLTVQTLLPLLNDGAFIILNASVAADKDHIGTSVYAAELLAEHREVEGLVRYGGGQRLAIETVRIRGKVNRPSAR